ncbi:MAG: hypothetical protein ABJ327_05260 [Litoreibacter sp.]
MSNSAKTSDVEDVLFSIRRLVSDTDAVVPVAPVQATSEPVGTLFLSSSLRVNPPNTQGAQFDAEDAKARLTHFQEAVAATGFSEPSSTRNDAFVTGTSQPSERRFSLSEVFDDLEGIEDTVEDETAQVPLEGVNVSATPSELSTMLQDVSQNLVDADVEIVDVPEAPWPETAEITVLGDYAASKDSFGNPSETEAVVETASEMVEQDDALVVDGTVEADESSPEIDLGDLDETALDEDALRDMITDIVRDELSGVLGERITRNVRKLVRREIQRALIAREFD